MILFGDEVLAFTHIINPVATDPLSHFYLIQQITFQSMLTAQSQVGNHSVRLYSAQYSEDHVMLQPGFIPTPDLTRSVLDVNHFKIPRKLPILHDILRRAFDHSHSNYVIYTNVDIGLKPHFYQAVTDFILQGYDSFAINRRTISDHYTSLSQIDEMYRETGKPHRGWDCFVFPRKWIPDFRLGSICIGAPLVGLALVSNLIVRSKNFVEFQDEFLTFHLGDNRRWNHKSFSDYWQFNYNQLMNQFSKLIEDFGNFPPESAPVRFLEWQSNPFKAAIYNLYTRYPLPLWAVKKIRK
jgi:hypothetical protein